MNKVGYDPVADFTAVAPIASIPFVLVANPRCRRRRSPT